MRNVTNVRDMRNAVRVLVGKTEKKETARRPRNKWKDNIKIDTE
jgi:hypothetical protein